MKRRNLSKVFLAPATLATLFALSACGGDSSSEPNDNDSAESAVSSSSVVVIESAAGPAVESSSEAVAVSSATDPNSVQSSDCVASPVTFPKDKFTDIGEVYKSIQCNEKVVFILRHGERESFIGDYSSLTEDGYENSIKAGAKTIGTEPFKYIFSGMLRTYETAAGFAVGRGDAACTADYAELEDGKDHYYTTCTGFAPDTLKELKDGWYLKDKTIRDAYIAADTTSYLQNSNVMITDWVYNGNYADAFYDLDTRSKEFVALLVKDYSEMPKYTLAASHDQVLMPLTAWATDKQIDLKLHDPASRNWLNYLAGVAIIINDKNELRYAAVKGMDDTIMPDGTVIDGGVQ